MILDLLKRLNEEKIVLTEDLAIQLNKEAKKKFKESSSDLIDEAIEEAKKHNFDKDVYKKILIQLKNSNFSQNKSFQKLTLNQYKTGLIDIEKLFEENAIQTLAKLYSSYGSQMDVNSLLLLNSEEVDGIIKRKTTFVHKLIEAQAPRASIINFFKRLDELAKDDKELVDNYLNLSDENGKSIRTIISEKSISTQYINIAAEIFQNNNNNNKFKLEPQENTHTASIHGTVDESFCKLALEYVKNPVNLPNSVSLINNRIVQVNRNLEWKKKIETDLKSFETKLSEIISSDNNIDELLRPTLAKEENIANLREKFKFQAQTALRLIRGLQEVVYGSTYTVSSNGPVSCGLTPKEIVAISYASLSDKDSWHNEDQETQHFIELVEHLYIAKRGYNIDYHGDEEWRTHSHEIDNNKCTGGTVNEIANGLKDHKSVTIKVITTNTMSPILLKNLPRILKQIAINDQKQDEIDSWFNTGIISKQLSDKIVTALKQIKDFSAEFSNSEIDTIAPQALRMYGSRELYNLKQMLKSNSTQQIELDKEEEFDNSKISSFVYQEGKGYILYLESLYYKSPDLFASCLKNIISNINNQSLYNIHTMKVSKLVDLLMNSKDQLIRSKTAEIFQNNTVELTKATKNQYLILNCQSKNSKIVESLIESGADITAQDTRSGHKGETPLICAARNGHAKIVSQLINAKTNLNKLNNNSKNRLAWAAKKIYQKLFSTSVKDYINIRHKYRPAALEYAARNGHAEVVFQLIQAGANVNLKSSIGGSALASAAFYGHAEVVSQLIKAGAKVDTKNEDSKTALIWAAQFGHTEIASKLIAAGAKMDAKDNNGQTALMLAAQQGNIGMFSQLIAAGAKIDEKDNNGQTVLMLAVRDRRTKIVSQLIKAGANIGERDKKGNTALMLAVKNISYDSNEVIHLLVDAGTNIMAKNKKRQNILNLARKNYLAIDGLTRKVNQRKKDDKELYKTLMLNDLDGMARILNFGYNKDKNEIDLTRISASRISKAISLIISQSSGYIYDDSKSWELIERIVKQTPKEKQLEVVREAIQDIDNISRRTKLLSFVSKELQTLIISDITPSKFEKFRYNTGLRYKNLKKTTESKTVG